VGIIFSILSTIFSGIQIKKNSTGLAIAGLVLGISGTLLNIIMLMQFPFDFD
jgi:hypothetical protein